VAVYTEVPFRDAAALLARLGLGSLKSLDPCNGGIENTNYFADTDTGRYVLTLFERLSAQQLPFYLHLMKHLAQRGITVPEPHADAHGALVHTLLGKPAAVVNRLPGRHHPAPDAAHCASVGAMLARMHLAGLDFPMHQPNLRGLLWWQETAPLVLPHLAPAQRELLESELAFQVQLAGSPACAALPRGPIHADLFRDNVMFDADRLTGFFDFYFAGVDAFVFDIAVCLNDWCSDAETGRLNEVLAQSFVSAYDAVKPLSGDELRLLAAMMRAAALRFWLSRLWDLHLPRQAHILQAHDPAPLERVLRARIDAPWHYLRA
jgi:homoserine kinase type II